MKFSHIDHIYSVKKIMFFVFIACIPGIITKCYFFGIGTLIQICFSIVIALLLEITILIIRYKKVTIKICDNSSILTATLLGVSVPSLLPFWIMIIGVFFAIVISKHLYGGIGQNIFNPAMVGYAVLLVSFPLYMTNWHEKNSSISYIDDLKISFEAIFFKKKTSIVNNKLDIFPDAFTEATPLDNFKNQSHFKYDNLLNNSTFKKKRFIVPMSWKYVNISFLFGGCFLLLKKIICWRIPISFLTTLGVMSSITHFYSTDLFASPLFHFFSGGTMICAFFIATDPVTTACNNKGKIIFGTMIGFLVWIIRNYSDYPDAIAFSILFANMTVPLIDFYTKTSGYGHNQV